MVMGFFVYLGCFQKEVVSHSNIFMKPLTEIIQDHVHGNLFSLCVYFCNDWNVEAVIEFFSVRFGKWINPSG